MKFDGAIVSEQGVKFAIAVVENGVFYNSDSYIDQIRNRFVPYFPDVPILLMSTDRKGRIVYHGRTDLTLILAGLDFRKINWKRYNANDLKSHL
ncbi:hypothetical protein [Ectobacillus panaciterrae]|uniref:hypothetical protein n=1 Tax=Ectobacillus panaciterrae TaxID=363872 RepID=UPI00138AE73F|nr:hypothetical protein [Ectobacillus panaciterrae]